MSLEEKNEQIEEIFSYYGSQKDKGTQEMVVSLLRELQEVEGCITPNLKERVIETTGITDKFLAVIMKMYPSIKESGNLHEIIVCTGERCGNKDSFQILQKIKKDLEIGKDGTSKDGKYMLRTRNCLKQCRTSPNILIDGDLYSGECVKDIKSLLKKINR